MLSPLRPAFNLACRCIPLISFCIVTHQTSPVFQTPQHPIVLGISYLITHNHITDWTSGRIMSWSASCSGSCLQSVKPRVEPSELSSVLSDYEDLWAVFSKSCATSFPPHRQYNCTIELLPGITPPKGHLYSLSPPEQQDMSASNGIIVCRPLLRGCFFFFFGKRDGGLYPCIDYRGLNKITIKNHYPLPLLSSAFEFLQDSRIFTELC